MNYTQHRSMRDSYICALSDIPFYILQFMLLGFTYSVACNLLSCKVVRQLKTFCRGFSGRICIHWPGFSGRICSYWPGFSSRICSYWPGFSSRICSYWPGFSGLICSCLPGFSCRNFFGMRKCKKVSLQGSEGQYFPAVSVDTGRDFPPFFWQGGL